MPGRIARARLEPQPDDAVPRFAYESHVRTLIEERLWPHSTTDISELRLVIDYQRQNGADRTLTLDIVDYPGEWLLDLRCSTRVDEDAPVRARQGGPALAEVVQIPALPQPWSSLRVTLSDEVIYRAPRRS